MVTSRLKLLYLTLWYFGPQVSFRKGSVVSLLAVLLSASSVVGSSTLHSVNVSNSTSGVITETPTPSINGSTLFIHFENTISPSKKASTSNESLKSATVNNEYNSRSLLPKTEEHIQATQFSSEDASSLLPTQSSLITPFLMETQSLLLTGTPNEAFAYSGHLKNKTFATPPPSLVTSSPLEKYTTKTKSAYTTITQSVEATRSYYGQIISTSVLEPPQNRSQLFLSETTGYIRVSASSSYKSDALLQSFANHSESHRYRTMYNQQTEVSLESLRNNALAFSSLSSVKAATERGYNRSSFQSNTMSKKIHVPYSSRSDISLSVFIWDSSTTTVQSPSTGNEISSYFTNVKTEMTTINASFRTTIMERTPLINSESFEKHNTSVIMSTPFSFQTAVGTNTAMYDATQITSAIVPSASRVYPVFTFVTATSSVVPFRPFVPVSERNIEVTLQITNEDFHLELENKSSTKYQELLVKVNKTLIDIYSPLQGFIECIINGFSNGSIIVNHTVVLASSSSASARQVEAVLTKANHNNSGGYVFGQIKPMEKCTEGFCMNSGTCQSNSNGAFCSCPSNYEGERCSALKVHGNYSNWSNFGACSKSCGGGQQFRNRTCNNPTPKHGGNNCSSLGPSTQFRDCNTDVRCPEGWWISLIVCLAVLVFIFILLLVLMIRRRRIMLQQEKKNGVEGKQCPLSSESTISGSQNAMLPLQTMAIHNRTNKSQESPEGHRNPEFISEKDDEDDDIYKTQLLLFIKQQHLMKPRYSVDDTSATPNQSRRQSRVTSAYSDQDNQGAFDNSCRFENEAIDVEGVDFVSSDGTLRVSGSSGKR